MINTVIERGECDFVDAIAAPFPIQIICDMLGVPDSQHAFVFEQTNIILGGIDPEYGTEDMVERFTEVLQAGQSLSQLMADMRQQRLQHPTDDLTSALVYAELDGDRLTDQELSSFFVLLVAAGNETTRNAISHGIKLLSDFPDQRVLWQSDFDAYAKTALEEIIRWASPVIYMRRTTTCDTEVGGQPLRQGEKVLLLYASANRDEAVFADPYGFDIMRSPNEHLGFGAGAHFCLGVNLARREMAVMFQELFQRLPDLEITGEPERLTHNFIHGLSICRVVSRQDRSSDALLPDPPLSRSKPKQEETYARIDSGKSCACNRSGVRYRTANGARFCAGRRTGCCLGHCGRGPVRKPYNRSQPQMDRLPL